MEHKEKIFNIIGIIGVCLYALSILAIGKLNQGIYLIIIGSLYYIKDFNLNKLELEQKMFLILIILFPIFEFLSFNNNGILINMIRESYKYMPIFLVSIFIKTYDKIKLILICITTTIMLNINTIYQVCNKNNFKFTGTFDGKFGLGHTAHCMAIGSFLILCLVGYSYIKKEKILFLISSISYIISIYFVILGQRRGAYLAVIFPLLFLFVVILLKLNKKKLLSLGIILILSFSTLVKTEFIKENRYYKRLISSKNIKNDSQSVRLILWKVSIKGYMEKPIFGFGEDNGKEYYLKYIEENEKNIEERLSKYGVIDLKTQAEKSNPHNMYFKKIIDNGLLGFYFSLFLIYTFFSNFIKIIKLDLKDNKEELVIRLGIFGSFFAFLIVGLTEDAWGTYVIKNMFFIILSIYFSLNKISKKN
ncbi:MAG: O-antigen ligase family protein [Fusobacterium perfoetens]|uniref:O-antigen ligase family protein n=1 Tax=Fusobacterium perfoetens TaxID=852 RepID=UPI0023F21277|nr:O-antigen ligase family protein [Fusobacterium perfoetens]MCI6152859.1 O-antigen ligase family protein [Fusobacterium perfoetens]MDY3237271.1 O-antigen ligase family protein [Fusobacterium perfoetens]